MGRHLYIPKLVKDSIKDHILKQVEVARDGFISAAADEDSVTGHLGGRLRTSEPQTVMVQQDEIPGAWTWAFDYYKFGGRGKDAAESKLGADGIFVMRLHLSKRVDSKSLLFQAKMGTSGGADLLKQCALMSTWRGASCVVSYDEQVYNVYDPVDLLLNKGNLRRTAPLDSLGNYLGHNFVDCQVGDTDLSYDARRRMLIWRSRSGEVVGVPFGIKHRISVTVQAPGSGSHIIGVDRIISHSDIHDYPLEMSDNEILGLGSRKDEEAVRRARRRYALAFHPDHYQTMPSYIRNILNRRMQEVNEAVARVRVRR